MYEQNETQEYTIKIIPKHGENIHSFHLPANWLRYGLGTLAVGILLFIGAFGYAVYSTFAAHHNYTEINELREVNNIQQEQLLQLSKKANALQDTMEQLNQHENELRRLSGSSLTDNTGTPHDGQGGPYPYVQPEVQNVNIALATLEKNVAQRKESLQQLQQDILAKREKMAAILPTMGQVGIAANMPSIWPARGEVSSPYGLRWNGSDFHPGIDIANDFGTPIVATADGIITIAGWNSGGYGNMVEIDHGNGITTLYGHAQQVVVIPGQPIRRGQVIAYMGSTGFSTGPHVHYEVSLNGQRVNPVNYLH